MVLSGSKKVSNMSSLVNRNSMGGSKKAGLVPRTNIDSWTSNHYYTHGIPQELSFVMNYSVNNSHISPPIGVTSRFPYWNR